MKDELYWPVLGTWLKDTAEAPPDPRQTARKVAERLPSTPQIRRRWWLPALRRVPAVPHNDVQQTVIGRTQTMLSPVKAIIASAFVFALGGAYLITQPFDQQPVAVPGAAEQTDLEGTRVAVAQDCDREVDPPACTWTSSDPRLTGTMKHELVGDIVSVAGLNGDFSWADATLEGAEGSWAGRLYLSFTDPPVGFAVLSGSGAYEGWQFIATEVGGDGVHDDWSGIIYEGELPPFGPPSVPASE